MPGTSQAVHEIAFHLERDADRWALRNRNDRLALARVICKAAATAEPAGDPAVARLAATGVRERLGQLLEEPPRRHATALNVIAAAMVALTLLLATAVPTAAVAGAGGDAHGTHHSRHCDR